MMPLSPYIEEATGMARGLGHTLTKHYRMSDGTIAIPPGEETKIIVNIRNIQNYELDFELIGDNPSGKAGISKIDKLEADRIYRVEVTIDRPDRSETEFFDLTINITDKTNDREMTPYILPRMQARYLQKEIDSISIDSVTSLDDTPIGIASPPADFDSDINSYTLILNPLARKIDLSVKFTSYYSEFTITALPLGTLDQTRDTSGDYDFTANVMPGNNPITVTVTADSGEKNTYTIVANVKHNESKDIITFKLDDNDAYFVQQTHYRDNNIPSSFTIVTDYETDIADMKVAITHTGDKIHYGTETAITTTTAVFNNVNFTNPVTFIVTDETGKTNEYKVTVLREIPSVEIAVPEPELEKAPRAAGIKTTDAKFSITTVEWSPTVNGVFTPARYTVTVTLTANSTYTFTDVTKALFAFVDEDDKPYTETARSVVVDGNTLKMSYTFLLYEPKYTITPIAGIPVTYKAEIVINEPKVVIDEETSIQEVINAIREDAEGFDCEIAFGTGGSSQISIGSTYVDFVNTSDETWGKITLSGNITGSSTSGTIRLSSPVSVEVKGTIAATATGYAIYNNNATGTVTVNGGTVQAATGRAIHNQAGGTVIVNSGTVASTSNGGRTIHNQADGTVTVNGGTVSSTGASGVAIYNNSTGTIIIDETDEDKIIKTSITSGNTSTGTTATNLGGTIVLANGSLIINGGTVSSTSTTADSRVINNNAGGTVTVNNGTVQTSTTTGRAIHNQAGGSVIVNGGTVQARGTSGIAIYNNGAGEITIDETDEDKIIKTLITSANTSSLTTTLGGTIVLAAANGSLIINSGTVSSTSTATSSRVINNNANSTVTVNGGTVQVTTGSGIAIYNNGAGTITIDETDADGVIKTLITSGGTSGYAISNYGAGTVTVSGGTVQATGATGRAIHLSSRDGRLTASGTTAKITANPTTGYSIYNAQLSATETFNNSFSEAAPQLVGLRYPEKKDIDVTQNLRTYLDTLTPGTSATDVKGYHIKITGSGPQDFATPDSPYRYYIPANTHIFIEKEGTGSLTLNLTAGTGHFGFNTNTSLTLKGNITLNGGVSGGAALVSVSNRNQTFTMESGVTITGQTTTANSPLAAGVTVGNGGVFNMNGGTINGNRAGSTLPVPSNNILADVYVSEDSTINMSGNASIGVLILDLTRRTVSGTTTITRPSLNITGALTGSVGTLHLRYNFDGGTGNSAANARQYWTESPIIISGGSRHTLTQADINRFGLGQFRGSQTTNATVDYESISSTRSILLNSGNGVLSLR